MDTLRGCQFVLLVPLKQIMAFELVKKAEMECC